MSASPADRVHELRLIAQRLAALPEDKQRRFLEQLRERGVSFTQLPIVAGPRPRRVPLSYAQRQQWFLWKLRPHSAAYHLALILRLRGALDAGALQRALNALVNRHESLRTSFPTEEGETFQRIAPTAQLAMQRLDVAPEATIAALEQELRTPFDLEHGLPLRATLIASGPAEHLLILTLHHIVADGWSLDILMRELAILYVAELAGEPAALPPLPLQYADFALWQQRLRLAGELEVQLDYWRKHLGPVSSTPELLPADRPRTDATTERGAHCRIEVDARLTARIQEFAQRRGMTLFPVLLASICVLLFRYSGQREIRIGTPVTNRTRVATESLIGYLMNTLVLRTEVAEDVCFEELAVRVKSLVQGALAHQELPFEHLVEALNPQRQLAANPLFNVLYTHEAQRSPAVRLPGLHVERLALPQRSVQVDLSIATSEQDGCIVASLLYAADLYDARTIERAAAHWRTLLERMIEHPTTRIGNIDLLSTQERKQLLVDWNDTSRVHEGANSLHGLVAEQAAKTPGAISVACANGTLSYSQLMAHAAAVARSLRSLGVRPGDGVAICMERGLDLVPSLLGILQTGAAYVPLDPEYPRARLAFMLGDAQPRVVLTQRSLLPLVTDLEASAPVWCVDALDASATTSAEPAIAVHPQSLAYCIYTSGSTGTPKGVAIPHRGIVNFLRSARLGLRPADRVLALASLSFDMSCLDLFLPLSLGATVVLADRALAADPHALLRYIRQEKVTALQATPTSWRLLVTHDEQETLRDCRILTGGESLPPDLARQLVAAGRGVCNLYGPTETSVYSAVRELTCEHPEPAIGRPLDNTTIHVLNESLQPQPAGVIGDLYIGGKGLAEGYLRRAALTAERFVADPFAAGERLYRTGDRARYRLDGVLECFGRDDQQIKIRGYRIELGEVEAALRSHAAVREAAVAAHASVDGDRFLVGYVVPAVNHAAPDEARWFHELASHLRASLPSYMVPAHYVCLPNLPRTPSGKLDRKALIEPVRSGHAAGTYVAPRGTLEAELATLWEDALGVRPIGVHDNFFDLGGHSLLAVQLTEAIGSGIGRRIPLSQLFQSQTVAELAESLSQPQRTDDASSLVVLQPTGTAPALCCIHPGGGQVLGYRRLAHSFKDRRPVYGLQSRLFYRDDWVDESIESMAEHYAGEIARQTAGRPVHLLGWSAGCFIANEAAAVLRSRGQAVLSLGMIDPVAFLEPPAQLPRPPLADAVAAARQLHRWMEGSHCRLRWQKLLALCDAPAKDELLRWFAAADLAQRQLSVADEYVHLTEAHYFMIMQKYRFRPAAGMTHLWWASQSLAARPAPQLPSDFVPEVDVIEADHLSIVNSTELHRQVHAVLERCDVTYVGIDQQAGASPSMSAVEATRSA